MTDERFEELVNEGIETIPARFLKQLKNVAIIIADEPTQEQLQQNKVPRGSTLLGLYEGIPLTERGDFYGTGPVLPDKISIFKHPILKETGGNEEAVRRVVRDTVWHEIAHYFGHDDVAIGEREDAGRNFSV